MKDRWLKLKYSLGIILYRYNIIHGIYKETTNQRITTVKFKMTK